MNDKKYRRHLEVFDKWSLNDTYKRLRSDYRVNLTIKVLAIMGYAFKDELSTYDIASFLGVSEASITGWVKIWNGKGLEGLANRTLLKKQERDLNKICKGMQEQNIEKGEIKAKREAILNIYKELHLPPERISEVLKVPGGFVKEVLKKGNF